MLTNHLLKYLFLLYAIFVFILFSVYVACIKYKQKFNVSFNKITMDLEF